VLNPSTQFTLHVVNGGLGDASTELASGSVITINGVQVVGPNNFNKNVTVLDVPVTLQSSNTISVQVKGKPGGVISVQVIGVDNDLPIISGTVSPPPNPAGWNNSSVTVNFKCSDKTSGVAFCPSPVSVTTEGANQVLTGTAMDKAGNTATASVMVNLDRTPPNISGTINPPPNAAGWNYSSVTVSFTCSDPISGVAICPSAVAVTTESANQVVTGTAVDIAGNAATSNITVNISRSTFSLRNYGGKCLDFGPPPQVLGSPVFIYDCNGTEAQQVRVEEINNRHEVILHAGTLVIGINNPPPSTLGGPPSPPQTEFSLELQLRANLATLNSGNQIFALDGDSIILASSRPCINTDNTLCSPPPPQFVVQVQKARGANRSPLVVAMRNLADSEFWDFTALDGSGKYPTSGFVQVATNDQLWNSICNSPKASSTTPPNFPPTILDPGQPDDGTFLVVPCYDPYFKAGWGTVIVIASDPNECTLASGIGPCIDLTGYPPLTIPAGVTIRGDRRGTNLGPQLFASYQNEKHFHDRCPWCMLEIRGDYARITGLRLHGQSRGTDPSLPPAEAIDVDSPGSDLGPLFSAATTTQFIAIIDHNDISDWGSATVNVKGPYAVNSATDTCTGIADDSATLANVRIERNFMHHNERWGGGYGSLTASGGRTTISGNTFLMNRHAIASDGEPHNEYRAWFNLVLSNVPTYYDLNFGSTPFGLGPQQDFDMHGTGANGSTTDGGIGGNQVDISWNTFLGDNQQVRTFFANRWNFALRGKPCGADYFLHNVSEHQDIREAIDTGKGTASETDVADTDPLPPPVVGTLFVGRNQFQVPNPTVRLGVGDFDGDGVQDLFLATGAAWYYSPGGNAEWRYLNGGKTDRIDSLLFGDFDGDGRTDVVGINGSILMVSWGGVSDWEVLNSLPAGASITDLAVGDFDGDGRADIFWADGQTWWVSYGGNTPFVAVQTSSHRVKDIRLGDFNGDGSTDVFSVVDDGVSLRWMVSYSPKLAPGTLFSSWTYLPVSLTNTVDGLLVADFDGDGRADIAMPSSPDISTSIGIDVEVTSWNWMFSHDGVESWTSHQITPTNQCSLTFTLQQLSSAGLLAGIGRFGGNAGADLLLWGDGNNFCIVPGGTGAAQRQSRQDMR
jgi:hypothetical protein